MQLNFLTERTGDSGERTLSVRREVGMLSLLIVASGLLAGGCASSSPYTPRTLPAEWRARPTTNVKTIGLAKLATDTRPVDQIAKGDVIDVSLAAGLSFEDATAFSVRINEQGYGVLPFIGPIPLEGLQLEDAESAIKVACMEQDVYRNPHVTVTMKQRKVVQVTVVGAVETEGTYHLASGSNGLLQAIAQAGGLSKDAGTMVEISYPDQAAHPEVPHHDPLIAQTDGSVNPAGYAETASNADVPIVTSGRKKLKLDLAALSETQPQQLQLVDGAVVSIERRDPMPIQVLGLVKDPAVFDYPIGKDLRLLSAISQAGGTTSPVADKIYVIRRRPDRPEPALIEVSMREAKQNGESNLLLEPGDTVSVEQTPATVFIDTIRLLNFNIGGALF